MGLNLDSGNYNSRAKIIFPADQTDPLPISPVAAIRTLDLAAGLELSVYPDLGSGGQVADGAAAGIDDAFGGPAPLDFIVERVMRAVQKQMLR